MRGPHIYGQFNKGRNNIKRSLKGTSHMKNVVNYILSAQKKIFVMAFLAVFSSFYTMVWGDTSYSITGSGTNKTLTITGTGAMPDFASREAPWYSEGSKIKHIV